MSLLGDKIVWSLALRHALLVTDQVFTTELVLEVLLQGVAGPKNRAQLVERLSTRLPPAG